MKVETILNSILTQTDTLGRRLELWQYWSAWTVPYMIKTVQTSEYRPAQTKPRMHFTIASDVCSLLLPRAGVKEHSRLFPPHARNITRPEEKYFFLFPLKSCDNCILFPVANMNVELMNHSILGWGSDFLSAIAGRVGSAFRRVGSDRVQEKWPVDNSGSPWMGI